MRGKTALLATIVAVLALPAPAAAEVETISSTRVTPRLVELVLRTPSLEEAARVLVLLPDGYRTHPKRHYPVVYLFHSAFGSHRAWYDGLDLTGMTAGYPAIFVMPDGGRGGWYTDHYNGGAGGPPRWETYHVSELVPFIDASFRTIAKRSSRALVGASMGGFGAVSYAARHPDKFGAAASISGAVDTNYVLIDPVVTFGSVFDRRSPASIFGPRLTQEVRWRGHNPVDLAANLRSVDVQILTHDGKSGGPLGGGPDPTELIVHAMSRRLHNRLVGLGIEHIWRDYGPGTHSIPYAIGKVRDALAQLALVFADPAPRPRRFSHTAIEPSFEVWGWQFAADPLRALEFLQVDQASRRGLTLTGSGAETVTTPRYFRRARFVEVIGAGQPQRVRPDQAGRITFVADLGPVHDIQQYTLQARLAGAAAPGYFQTRRIEFAVAPRRRNNS